MLVSSNEYSDDEYFIHITEDTRNFNTESIIRYIQFWIKQTLKDLCCSIQSGTNNLSLNFDNYDVQHQSVTYMYCLKYYEVLDMMINRSTDEDVPSSLGLSKLMSESTNVHPEAFITLCQSAKLLVK